MGKEVEEWLGRLAEGASTVRLNARSAAELVTNVRCGARRALDAAQVDKEALARRLGEQYDPRRGQSPFALGRGNQFERRLKRDEYMLLLEQMRSIGLDTSVVEVIDLKSDVRLNPKDMDSVLEERAARTREAIVEIATGRAPAGRLIDGGALVWSIGGVRVRLEADAIAWWLGGQLRVVEIKSFPVEWGQIPKEKVVAAAWQTAVYVAALQDLLVDEDLDPGLVSTEIFLVCPRNTGLKPTIVRHDVAPQLRLLRRHEEKALDIAAIARHAPDVTLNVRDEELPHVLRQLRPAYQPNCLSTCDLAFYCRARAQEEGESAALGAEVLQLTRGPGSLVRAARLVNGARPANDDEADFVALVAQVRHLEEVLGR